MTKAGRPFSIQTINIKATLEANNLKPSELAKIIQCGRHVVLHWLRGHNVSVIFQNRIVKNLNKRGLKVIYL